MDIKRNKIKMKRIVIVLLIFLSFPVEKSYGFFEEKIQVTILKNFSGSEPYKKVEIKTENEYFTNDGILFEKDSIIRGKVIEIRDAKRAKTDAYFICKIEEYTKPSQCNKIERLDNPLIAQSERYIKGEKLKTIESVSTTTASFLSPIPGISAGYYLLKGMIKKEENENRIKSGLHSVYNNSIISYVEKGANLNLKSGDLLYLKLYPKDSKRAKKITEAYKYREKYITD